ncbi:MAG: ABC transporter permease subunit [Hespellia sp.]|jgi:hypothetical protein|nr:ABC transporter permease subunit [Hespellia sp.]
MLYKCIKAERLKLKHSTWLLLIFLIPVLPALIGSVNYSNNITILSSTWYSLWTQHTLFYANFFFAPLIGTCASFLWKMEHQNHNWNTFMTMPISPASLYLGKLSILCGLTIFLQLWVGLLFFAAGKYFHFSGFPSEICWWLLRGTLGGLVVCTIQLLLSMIIRSFSVPIMLALLGGISGFLMTTKDLGLFNPYSLVMLGMNANKNTDSMAGEVIPFLLSSVFFLVIISTLAVLILKKRDVRTV